MPQTHWLAHGLALSAPLSLPDRLLEIEKDKKEQTCFRTLLFAQATGRHSDAPPWFDPLVVASYIGTLKL
jgi:hypothetical protein